MKPLSVTSDVIRQTYNLLAADAAAVDDADGDAAHVNVIQCADVSSHNIKDSVQV